MRSSGYRGTIVLFLCAMALGVYVQYMRHAPPPLGTRDYAHLKRSWEGKFSEVGTRDAYREFTEEGRRLPYERSHTIAHVVGAILYDREGIDGVAHCSGEFGYGCFHGFAGRIIEREGTSGIDRFARACESTAHRKACEHGIGHGLLAYLSDSELNAALDLCPVSGDGRVGACHNGVFMEYFFNTLRRNDGLTLRPFDANSPEGPCQSGVSKTYRGACYYELPAWWRAHSSMRGASYAEQFSDAGSRCARVDDGTLRDMCFAGVGAQVAPISENDANLMREWCALMGEEGSSTCLDEAMRATVEMERQPRD